MPIVQEQVGRRRATTPTSMPSLSRSAASANTASPKTTPTASRSPPARIDSSKRLPVLTCCLTQLVTCRIVRREPARHADIARCRTPGLVQPSTRPASHAGGVAGVVRADLVRGPAVQLGGKALQRFGCEVSRCHGQCCRFGQVYQYCTGWPAFMIQSAAPKIVSAPPTHLPDRSRS